MTVPHATLLWRRGWNFALDVVLPLDHYVLEYRAAGLNTERILLDGVEVVRRGSGRSMSHRYVFPIAFTSVATLTATIPRWQNLVFPFRPINWHNHISLTVDDTLLFQLGPPAPQTLPTSSPPNYTPQR